MSPPGTRDVCLLFYFSASGSGYLSQSIVAWSVQEWKTDGWADCSFYVHVLCTLFFLMHRLKELFLDKMRWPPLYSHIKWFTWYMSVWDNRWKSYNSTSLYVALLSFLTLDICLLVRLWRAASLVLENVVDTSVTYTCQRRLPLYPLDI